MGALARLSDVINAEQDEVSLCLRQRADYRLNLELFADALEDYDLAIADNTPYIVERFGKSLKFRLAYVLAQLAKPEYHDAIAEVDAGYSEWIAGERRGVQDLKAMYRSQKNLSPREGRR